MLKKDRKFSFIILLIFSISSIISNPAFSCSYQMKGLSEGNYESVEKAMKSISPEVKIDKISGELSFYSKKAVTEKQISSALETSGVKNVKVVQVKHKH